MKKGFEDAAEQFAQDNGHVTASVLDDLFSTFKENLTSEIKAVHKRLDEIIVKDNINPINVSTEDLQTIYDFGPSEDQGLEVGVQGFGIFPMFHTEGKILMVPKNYSFPQGFEEKRRLGLVAEGG